MEKMMQTKISVLQRTNLIRHLPKAELHVHLEGTLEPEMIFQLAERNRIPLKWKSPDELRSAYSFRDLPGFLEVYFKGCEVMMTEADFHDVTKAYLKRAAMENVRHTEVFLGPQSFLARGIRLQEILGGILSAVDEMREHISCFYLPSVLRTGTGTDALEIVKQLAPWYDRIAGFGMGGAEKGNPPSRFAGYYSACRERGFRTTVHAGEEGPASYVKEALEILQVDRIDHGNASAADAALLKKLAQTQTPLTLCPVSNLKLNVVKDMKRHPLKKFLDAGLCVTVNSDDPAYFQAYLNDNWQICADTFDLNRSDLLQLAKNSFEASFLPKTEKRKWIAEVETFGTGEKEYRNFA